MSTIKGTNGNDNLTGTALSDLIYGYAGNDTINGGTGADTMYGGTGNDVYYVDNSGDKISEKANEGTDTVISKISYVLGNYIENLTLSGSSNINATGNSLNNYLVGNSGNNVINGKAGADTMVGGKGNDTYYVDSNRDKVVEKSNEGTDTVYSSISYTLTDNVENLTLSANNNLNATGNKLNNYIIGNDYGNILDGKAGKDTMVGGGGSDTYYIDNTGDKIIEDDSNSLFIRDIAISSVSYTLPGGVEDMILSGKSNINGYGNDSDNIIFGNSGNNTLRGGKGNDTLSGDYGNDTYSINQGTDLINDIGGDDKILFESSVSKNSIAFYTDGFNLDFAYGDDSYLTVQDQNAYNTIIEKVQLSNKYYLTDDEINSVIQQMDSFADSHGILLTSVNDVKNNPDLMNIIASAWHK